MIPSLPAEWRSQGQIMKTLSKTQTPLFQKYMNEHSQFMVLESGQRVHYRIEGHGYPLLLIHGAFASLHAFDGWTEELKPYFQIIRLDLPGFGLSSTDPDDAYTMQHVLDFLCIFLDKLGIDQCNLAGSSLGGWISWELALRQPELVHKLVLIDSAGYLDSASIPLPFKMARTPFLNRIAKYTIRRAVLSVFMKQVFHDASKVTEELIDRFYELNNLDGNAEAFVRMVNIKLVDHTNLLHKIQHPTLIMWGKQDNWIPIGNAYRFNLEIPNAELIIYDGAGHIPMEECPKLTASDLYEFLEHG